MRTLEEMRAALAEIRRQMREAAERAGRDPASVLLCAASKTQTPETVRLAASLDIDRFGENRAQELVRNYDAGAYLDKPVDMIGHLQTNKVRQVVGRAALIHSVDSLRLMECIHREAEKQGLVQDILIEVNLGGEASKSGVAPQDLDTLLLAAADFPCLRVRGLMAIPPKAEEMHENTGYFESLSKLFIDRKAKKYDNVFMDFLSMGMSGDYCSAIEQGSNMIRVGSAVFGPRPPMKQR